MKLLLRAAPPQITVTTCGHSPNWVLGAQEPKKWAGNNPESLTTFCPLSIALDNTAGWPSGQHVVTGLLLEKFMAWMRYPKSCLILCSKQRTVLHLLDKRCRVFCFFSRKEKRKDSQLVIRHSKNISHFDSKKANCPRITSKAKSYFSSASRNLSG